ncbi:hypothetical protein ACFQ3S_17270 [Mucilaginibacter terrae]|uniref:transglutaminase domain-containing protein n=1 Tax=Mucilaginibacter terrae TaxID=1955052 RepID=UPI003641918A
MKKTLLIYLLLCPVILLAQSVKKYPAEVERVLNKAGKNRTELEKALKHYGTLGDPLKLQAVKFLIANMDIHYSSSYYWADSAGKRVNYNELDYKTFNSALAAFDSVKKITPGIHPQAYRYADVDSVKASFLIENIERAFAVRNYPAAKNLSFKDFCEYVLPYRVSVEPLQNWRSVYSKRFAWLQDSTRKKDTETALYYLAKDLKLWFTNTWGVEQKTEPLPRLGAIQLLNRQKGSCDDISVLEVFTLRSQGYPAAVNVVPYWATSTGTHFFNNTFNKQMVPIPFDASSAEVKINKFPREPSKIIRETYSRQPGTLASFKSNNEIPSGFMRSVNYIDVTSLHFETQDVICKIETPPVNQSVAYAYVFNGGTWRPTWWGSVKDGKVIFKDMCKGAVFLPAYYIGGKHQPAGYPVAAGINGQLTLQPDTLQKRTITIMWQEQYLVFRPGKKYKLFYWDNQWKMVGENTAGEKTTEMDFEGVPLNALLLLRPEYSEGKERPFTIDKDGKRQWW